MIVRNEAPVIGRCLDSVRHLIDRWVIVDTGSTDSTREIIRARLADLPGQLYDRPWVDFGHNRSEALELACAEADRCDYLLVIDADEQLVASADFQWPELTLDSYDFETRFAGTVYLRRQLISTAVRWRWVGVVHEYLTSPDARIDGVMDGVWTLPHRDGARARDPETYRKDAELLERALVDDPDNARHVFYLAQSYRDAGELELALEQFRRRVGMAGWAEEGWFARYQIGRLLERRGDPWATVMAAYLDAWSADPTRAEPLYRVGVHYQRQGDRPLAHLFLRRAAEIPHPGRGRLFVETAVYAYMAAVEYAVAAYFAGDDDEAIRMNNAALARGDLPAAVRERVIKNRRFSLDRQAGVTEAGSTGAGATESGSTGAGATRQRALPATSVWRRVPRLPLISCLMVSENRPHLAQRAIRCFAEQSWPNRELVIVSAGDAAYRDALGRSAGPRVRVIEADEAGLTLGQLRNRSLDSARGELICQWDDDDLHHPDRLLRQYEALLASEASACCLSDHLQLFEDEGVLGWTDWTLSGLSPGAAMLPGSILAFADPSLRYPERGPEAQRGEDSVYLKRRGAERPVATLAGAGHLYIYCYHGANTYPRAHHVGVGRRGLTAAQLRERVAVLREVAAVHSLPGPLTVAGRDGPAFVL